MPLLKRFFSLAARFPLLWLLTCLLPLSIILRWMLLPCVFTSRRWLFGNCFRENPDNKVIWQADHEVALVWRTPRGANFNSYEFKAFLRQQDGSFREIGRYSVMSGYGYWDEKNIQFSNEGFQIVLIADGGATHASHQFHYFQPAATFVFRLGREEGRRSNEEVQMGNGC